MFHLPKSLLLLAFAFATQNAATATQPAQTPLTSSLTLRGPRIQNGLPLIVLPLGNSITWGYGSTSGNGYREPLLNLLSPPNPVTFIGSQRSGNMSNNQNEGHPGALIDQIATYAHASLPQFPNIILLMAGTNDINNNANVSTAPSRLGALIDLCVSSCPNAVLLVAELTPILNNDSQARADVFNAAVPGLVKERVGRGKKVLAVNMTSYMGVDELMDGLHPNDEGYEAMARAFYDGIREAAGKGWIGKAGNEAGGIGTVSSMVAASSGMRVIEGVDGWVGLGLAFMIGVVSQLL